MAPRTSSLSSRQGCSPPASPQDPSVVQQLSIYPQPLSIPYTGTPYKIPTTAARLVYQEGVPVVITTAAPSTLEQPPLSSPIQTTCSISPVQYDQGMLPHTVYNPQPQPQQLIQSIPPQVVTTTGVVAYPQPLYQHPPPLPTYPVFSAVPALQHLPPPPPLPAHVPVMATPQPHEEEMKSFQCSTQMELVWNGQFSKLFSQFPNQWNLIPTISPPEQEDDDPFKWHEFQDSAKVRFCCQKCGKAWTSMKGQVTFWYRVDQEHRGLVGFRLYGQTCGNCRSGDEHAMWYPEEVAKVIDNIFLKVGETYYGFPGKNCRYHQERRPGKPRSQHSKDLCQACREGTCRK